VDGGYRISKNIRDMCIFAQHNVADDPPFSQMDLVCCRNLLIYLEPILQSKVISLFHYALRQGGFLVLGTSEGVGSSTNLFAAEDRVHKVFSKKAAARQLVTFSLNRQSERGDLGPVRAPSRQQDSSWNYMEAQKEFDRRLITQYVPATVFLNEDLEIVHSRGNVSRYLKLPPGRATLSVLKMAREGLFLELRNALARSNRDKTAVRRTGIQMRVGNGNGQGHAHGDKHAPEPSRLVDFEITPITVGKPESTYYMVVFDDTPSVSSKVVRQAATGKKKQETEESPARIAKLENELAATKEYLQSIIETHEATNEELQSANEEILSSNEELQSTNEELETAKEELQSANEELSTVNDELRNRNAEITQINSDLTNLLSSIDLAVVMVGKDLTIRRFTPQSKDFLGLIASDVGRPFISCGYCRTAQRRAKPRAP
jgi:two-component system CheB/CheR fusion protein